MTEANLAPSHRERLLLAGEELMVEYSNFDFGVREVVERAGVSLRTFYQYFETRDDFALAIYGELVQKLVAALERTMPRGARSTKFRHFVRALISPTEWGLMLAEYREEAEQRSRALIREGFHLREVRPEGYELAIAPLRQVLEHVLGDGANELDVTVVLNSLITETYSVIINGSDGIAI